MGQVQACAQTGLMFIQGVGVKQDIGKGLTVLLNTCDQLEHGMSCFAAGENALLPLVPFGPKIGRLRNGLCACCMSVIA